MTINIKYFTDILPIEINNNGDRIDLRAAEDIDLNIGEFKLIPLGVGMKLPNGYEAHIAPRSSTYKKWGIIQANSVAVIDNSYCGNEDEWKYPVIALRSTHIYKNDRICQFRIVENQPQIEFNLVNQLEESSRGGFGSTGTN